MTADHPDFLRSPDKACIPDPRNEGLVNFADPSSGPITINDQYVDVAALELHSGVPEEIRVQFETTKNLYLYCWFVYRFYPVAHHHAFTTLELSLRERFEKEIVVTGEEKREHGPGLKRLLSYAIENSYLKNEGFRAWRHATEMRARHRMVYEKIEEMERLGLKEVSYDEDAIEIKDIDRDHDMLRPLIENYPNLRNRYAHGSKMLHNHVLGTLIIVSEIINQIFTDSHEKDITRET